MSAENSAGSTCISYLRIALDYAERGQWEAAEANAEEAAKYADTAQKIERVKPS